MSLFGRKDPINTNTLTNLLTTKPTDENYEEVMDLLAELAQVTYEDYKFFIARSSDETKASNFLQITSPASEEPELHKKIFAKAIDCGIDMKELQKRFAERVAANQVLDLGHGVVVITDDGSGQLPTGVSPIQNGLEGSEITFIISFVKYENYDAWHKNTFPEPEPTQEPTPAEPVQEAPVAPATPTQDTVAESWTQDVYVYPQENTNE